MDKKPIICGHCCDPHWTKGLSSTLPLILAVLIETVEVGGSCVYVFPQQCIYLYYLYQLRKDNSVKICCVCVYFSLSSAILSVPAQEI